MQTSTNQTSQLSTFHVDGMTCGSCRRHIHGALEQLPGIERVEVDLANKQVRVTHRPSVEAVTIVSAIEAEGYGARPL